MPREGMAKGFLGESLAGLLILQALAAGAYWWVQPRGFTPWTAPFIEHEILVPCLFAASLAGATGVYINARAALMGTGLLAGFCLMFATVTLFTGSTVFAYGLGALALIPLATLAMAWRATARHSIPFAWALGAFPFGLLLGVLFLVCTWAPPSTTNPSGHPPEPLRNFGEAAAADLELSPGPCSVSIHRRGKGHVTVFPFMEFHSVSASGHWTIFDYGSLLPSRIPSQREADGSISLISRGRSLNARARVWVQGDEVRIISVNTLETGIAAHLATAVRIYAPGPATILGHPWRGGEPREFVAFREGRLELLRAARREKGPFTLIADLPPGDPVIEAGPWRIQVRGWAAQASRTESPTAGWGVSQGAIESDGDTCFWSLAATSVGRGFHAVRTAPGTYAFEIVVAPLR